MKTVRLDLDLLKRWSDALEQWLGDLRSLMIDVVNRFQDAYYTRHFWDAQIFAELIRELSILSHRIKRLKEEIEACSTKSAK